MERKGQVETRHSNTRTPPPPKKNLVQGYDELNQVHLSGTRKALMSKATHYTPPLTRFNVCVLYHQAKRLRIPMTQLANNLVETGLRDSPGWKEAQAQTALGEGVAKYSTK